MTAQVHEELYCSSDNVTDDAGEAAGGGVVAAGGFLRTRNIVIGSDERCFFFRTKMLLKIFKKFLIFLFFI